MLGAVQQVGNQFIANRQQYINAFFTNPRLTAAVGGIGVSIVISAGDRFLKFFGLNRADPMLDALKVSFLEFEGVDMSDQAKVAKTILKIGQTYRQYKEETTSWRSTQNAVVGAYKGIQEKSKAVI